MGIVLRVWESDRADEAWTHCYPRSAWPVAEERARSQGAFGLPFGLLMVLVCGGELFTGNTALVTVAVRPRYTLSWRRTGVQGLGNYLIVKGPALHMLPPMNKYQRLCQTCTWSFCCH